MIDVIEDQVTEFADSLPDMPFGAPLRTSPTTCIITFALLAEAVEVLVGAIEAMETAVAAFEAAATVDAAEVAAETAVETVVDAVEEVELQQVQLNVQTTPQAGDVVNEAQAAVDAADVNVAQANATLADAAQATVG